MSICDFGTMDWYCYLADGHDGPHLSEPMPSDDVKPYTREELEALTTRVHPHVVGLGTPEFHQQYVIRERDFDRLLATARAGLDAIEDRSQRSDWHCEKCDAVFAGRASAERHNRKTGHILGAVPHPIDAARNAGAESSGQRPSSGGES